MGWFDIRAGESSPLFLCAWLWAALPVIVPPAPRFCDCVCAHCVFRLISLTPSCSDEAGQITLSAQPTQSVQNEEREQQSTVFSTVSCSAEVDVNSDLFTALCNLYYSKQAQHWRCQTAKDWLRHLFQIHCTVN